MDFFLFIKGYYQIIMSAKDYKRCFSICNFRGIVLQNIQLDESNEEVIICRCRVFIKDYLDFLNILKKTEVTLENAYLDGLPKWFYRFKYHIYFVIGAIIALFLLISFTNRIWDIRINGNVYYGDETIIRYLEEQYIICGTHKKEIECIKLADQMRGHFDRITWASVELNGSILIINLKENHTMDKKINNLNENVGYDLVADKNGIIVNILVRNGISNVKEGESVKIGDSLITGSIPIKDDTGDVVLYQKCIADGDIYILTRYNYYHNLSRIYENVIIIDDDIKYDLYIDKFRTDNCINDDDTIIITENFKLSFTDGYKLPAGILKTREMKYKTNTLCYSDNELKHKAEIEFYQFCRNLEKKGVQIYENDVKINITDVSCVMSGEISVIEKVGVLKECYSTKDYINNLEE